jgi:hypothetical protein
MPVSRDQFDADLAAQQAATTDYIAAVDAFIALPPVIDLANEDATVQAALTAIADAKSRIPVPPTPKP